MIDLRIQGNWWFGDILDFFLVSNSWGENSTDRKFVYNASQRTQNIFNVMEIFPFISNYLSGGII